MASVIKEMINDEEKEKITKILKLILPTPTGNFLSRINEAYQTLIDVGILFHPDAFKKDSQKLKFFNAQLIDILSEEFGHFTMQGKSVYSEMATGIKLVLLYLDATVWLASVKDRSIPKEKREKANELYSQLVNFAYEAQLQLIEIEEELEPFLEAFRKSIPSETKESNQEFNLDTLH